MATPRKGTAKRNRACGVCKPYVKEGNGGKRFDRALGAVKPMKHKVVYA
jgi:hypothetical protein